MNVQDGLYMGSGFTLRTTAQKDPTEQQGCGPLGRIATHNVIPLIKQAAQLVALQHTSTGVPLTLFAGTGVTTGLAPDGSGRTVYILDTPRALSYTTSASMSGVNLTARGFDIYGQPMTQTRALPASATTVNTLKAFASILSITPDATDGTNNVSVGYADIFGLPFAVADAGYIISAKWAETLADDAGTFVPAVLTFPSTAALGDVRGTYAPSSASDGTKRLVITMHLTDSQCGPLATAYSPSGTVVGAIGVQQV